MGGLWGCRPTHSNHSNVRTCTRTFALDTSDLHQSLLTFWSNHESELKGAKRDFPRLVERVDVDATPDLPPALHALCGDSAVFQKALRISHLFGGDELATCVRAIKAARASADSAGPTQVAALFATLGMNDSPTVRVLKCVQQYYVLSAYADLKDGPLKGVLTNDDRSAQGWRVHVSASPTSGSVRVVHKRRERLPEYTGAYVHWELAMSFSGNMAEHTSTELRVARVELPAPTITVVVNNTVATVPVTPQQPRARKATGKGHRSRAATRSNQHGRETAKLLKKMGLKHIEVLLTRADVPAQVPVQVHAEPRMPVGTAVGGIGTTDSDAATAMTTATAPTATSTGAGAGTRQVEPNDGHSISDGLVYGRYFAVVSC